jgi:hypothetical protein
MMIRNLTKDCNEDENNNLVIMMLSKPPTSSRHFFSSASLIVIPRFDESRTDLRSEAVSLTGFVGGTSSVEPGDVTACSCILT